MLQFERRVLKRDDFSRLERVIEQQEPPLHRRLIAWYNQASKRPEELPAARTVEPNYSRKPLTSCMRPVAFHAKRRATMTVDSTFIRTSLPATDSNVSTTRSLHGSGGEL